MNRIEIQIEIESSFYNQFMILRAYIFVDINLDFYYAPRRYMIQYIEKAMKLNPVCITSKSRAHTVEDIFTDTIVVWCSDIKYESLLKVMKEVKYKKELFLILY